MIWKSEERKNAWGERKDAENGVWRPKKERLAQSFCLAEIKAKRRFYYQICNASRAADCGEANRLIRNSLKHTLGGGVLRGRMPMRLQL
jgi:hypothetical protein